MSSDRRWRLRLSTEAKETLAYLGGLSGMGWLVATKNPEPIFVGAFLTMMGFSLGAGWDRVRRERRELEPNADEAESGP